MKIEEYIEKIAYVDIVEEDMEEIQYRLKRLEAAFSEYLEAIDYIQNWIYSIEIDRLQKYNIKNRNRYVAIEQSKNFYIYMDKKTREYIAVKKE